LADGAVAIYFDAAAVITMLVLLGQVLELGAREPKTAVKVKADGTDEAVQVDAIQVNDLLRVGPGEKVPVDGELTDGCLSVCGRRGIPRRQGRGRAAIAERGTGRRHGR